MRIARLAIIVLPLAMMTATETAASDKSDVEAAINRYNDDFNKGDAKSAAAICSPQMTIVDDFAPHAWQGAAACTDWWNALGADNKKNGITEPKVTLGTAWHVSVTGDRAYAVYPTQYAYKLKGKPVTEKGVWTFAMQKTSDGWHIVGWAWAQH